MSKLTNLTAVCAVALALSGPALAQDADTVVATVNDTDITLGHMIAFRQSLGQQADQMPAAELYDGILDQLISMAVLAEGRDLTSVDQLFIENEERSRKANSLVSELLEDDVSDEAITEAYKDAFGEWEGAPEFDASHILVKTEEEAQALIDELDGGADFAELAKENSTGPSGPSGGALGWFGPGQMVPEFDEAVQDMNAGEVAGPVQTDFGWHVIKLNDTRITEAPSLEDVRDDLAQRILSARVGALIEERREAADIERVETEFDPAIVNDTSVFEK